MRGAHACSCVSARAASPVRARQADREAQAIEAGDTSPTTTSTGRTLSRAFESMGDVLGYVPEKLGEGAQWAAGKLGVPSQYSTIVGGLTEGGANLVMPLAAGKLLGAVRSAVAAGADTTGEAAAAGEAAGAPGVNGPAGSPQSLSAAAVEGGALPRGAPALESAPVPGGLPESYQGPRTALLNRIGIANPRKSAIAGDAKQAATDYQVSKFDEPAGHELAAQFDAERRALTTHAEDTIAATGGTIGTEESALTARGQTIARPFEALSGHYDDQMRAAYDLAQARSEGMPTTQLEGLGTLLQDPTFRNTLLARDQGGLLNAAQSQLEQFRKGNPQGFTPAGAEQARQWFNQLWSPERQWALGQMKGALDEDVTRAAGEDVYESARSIRAEKAAVLEDPKAISQLFASDPNVPINRVTPFEKIPDRIMALPVSQFQNLIETLRAMPEAIQPDAQDALGEIRGHLVNRLLNAGSQTSAGGARGLWGADAVSREFGLHEAKFRIAFANEGGALARIEDLVNAGQVLKANPTYPGAAAQTANVFKRGVLTHVLQHAGEQVGAGVGSAVAGPFGAAVGATLGKGLTARMAARAGERAALRAVRQRMGSAGKPQP
ncbi:MAG: hypothetical protein ACREU3_03585 [Steroidobacteraceae bacterium]